MEFKEIELSDRLIIQSYLEQEKYAISDISFANLYLWHQARKIAYTILYDCLIIQTTYTNQNPFYFFPIGNGDKIKAIKMLWKNAQQSGQKLEFHSIEKHALDFFQEYFSDLFNFNLNRDRSDYVYSIQELITLNGRKYHKKKNHLNKFLQSYPNFTYEPISNLNYQELLAVWKQWFEKQNNPSIGLKNENFGIIETLKHWEDLQIEGGIVRVENKIIAFSFGEIINETMAVIHIEKADSSFAGAYQIINQQFLANSFSHLSYVNREEDLGIEGLRKAKMSYHPSFLVDKYEIYFTS